MKDFVITVKGYLPTMVADMQLNRQYADVQYGYDKIEMKGTDEDLSAFIKELRKKSPGINIVGIDW